MGTRLVYVVTHPATADHFLRGQLSFMRKEGFDVTVISAPGEELAAIREREGVDVVAVPMERQPNPRQDAISLAYLARELRRLRPDIVHASTPKAGLLGMIAARALGVRRRIYVLRGLRLETATGALRRILGATERIASACAHEVICVSPSLRDLAVGGGWIPREKARVLGSGSSNGVDVARFTRTLERRAEGRKHLLAAGVADGDPVIVFVGRPVRDKGIVELLDAFDRVRSRVEAAKLVLVGSGFADDDLEPEIRDRVRRTPGAVDLGRLREVAPIYAASDVVAFPSYREGFPNVPLEAACAGLPVVGFRSTGVVDAVEDGETGTLVRRGDVEGLAGGLVSYLTDPELSRRTGAKARQRAESHFARERVWRNWSDAFRRL